MNAYLFIMDLIRNYPLVGLALLMVIVGLTLWIVFKIQKFFRHLRMRRLRGQGVTGEKRAQEILTELGFEIVADNESSHHTFMVDNKEKKFLIRPDIKARLDGEDWIVEVKNGADSGIGNRLTRRQLLEYSVQFPEYNIALLDVQEEKLIRIEF